MFGKDRFENCLKQLFWFQDIKMCGIKSSSFFEFITNQNKDLIKNDLEKKTTDISSESALIIRNNNVLSLWPLILFSPPHLSSKKDNNDTVPITQIYVRKDVVRLQFTPIDVEGYSQTEKGDDAVEAFKSLFRFNDQNLNTEKNFQFKILQKKLIEMLFKWLGVLMINIR